ncbi:MAG: UvrD-helicase domain-containing protein [Myxococcales bacterium]|nr:UvrD-helicase domain-containing protein [Myxococcota bacterium]MDW8280615.1 UvrD-helicase domain-containing protein [Myxococcales bacterium]
MNTAERFLLRRDRAVQAGAGTGKTHALVTQYLHLCAGLSAHGHPLEPRRIVALTFTEKAAGEMQERIRQRMHALRVAAPEGAAALATLEPDLHRSAQLLGRPLPDAAHWERMLDGLGAAHVSTFHAFSAGLLRRYPTLAGIDPDFLLLDEEQAHELELEATEEAVLAALEEHQGPETQPLALLVGEYGFRGQAGGEALVELLCRVRAQRAEEGLGPEGIARGYTEQAVRAGWTAARSRLVSALRRLGSVADLLGGGSTVLARELAAEAPLLEALLGSPSDLPHARSRLTAIPARLARLRAKSADEASRRVLAGLKAQIRQGLAELEATGETAQAAPLAAAFERMLVRAWQGYEQAKAQRRALDFTDLLRRARDLVRDHAEVRAALRTRFAVWLVDECQDTNPLQAELLFLLCGEPAERSEGPGRLYLVGDRKQSIYEFRGADVASFESMRRAILQAGGDEETLSVSRRSRPGVLALCNALFARVMRPPEDAALPDPTHTGCSQDGSWPAWLIRWDPQRDPLYPLRPDDGTEPAAELLCPAEGSTEETPDDPTGTEAQLLARHILTLHAQGRRFGEMAVLLRRFTQLTRYVVELRRAGIPHYVVRGRGFFTAQEVRDVCAALTLVEDPEDVLALVTLLRSPLCGVSDETLTRLHLAGCLRLSKLQHLEAPRSAGVPAEECERMERILPMLAQLSARGDRLGPGACLRALYEGTDLLPVLLAGPEGEQRVANLEHLAIRAQHFEDTGQGLRAFIRWLRLQCDPSPLGDFPTPQAPIVSEQDDVVRIMTVHQAKGLEFPVVFVPGCASRERIETGPVLYDREVGLGLSMRRGGQWLDTLPSRQIRHIQQLRREAESARLFYVAVTRARDRVVFLGEGRRTRGSWREHLDALLQSAEGHVLTLCPVPLRPERPPPQLQATASEAEEAARTAVSRVCRPVPPPAGEVELPLAAAVDLALCPRRFHLRHVLLLEEEPRERSPVAAEERGPDERWPIGTLAHHLLRRVDLSARGADLPGLLLAQGCDPEAAQMVGVRTRLLRLLQSPALTEWLQQATRIRRAVPFRLHLPGGGIRVRGLLSLLIEASDGTICLLDVLDGHGPVDTDGHEGTEGAELRRALLSHLAQKMAASRVRVGLCYLGDADPSPRMADVDPAAAAAALGRLHAVAALAGLGERAALQLPVLPPERCTALGCGYRLRCHGISHSQRPT